MTISIQEILKDHWQSFYEAYKDKIRPVVIQEVEKVIKCGDPAYGFTSFKCPNCGQFKFVPFRCHSRFCNTCGMSYQADRCAYIAAKLIRCRHRHVVFTIPEELRWYFQKDRNLLHVLFRSAAQVINYLLSNKNKKEQFEAGMVLGLHTFGRDLKWNPHIHMLLTEGVVGKITPWKKYTFFPFNALRKSWMKVLLENLLKELDRKIFNIQQYKNLVNRLYNTYKGGFYVNAPKTEFNSPETVAKYITRYIGRPAMAQSRISNYDGENVTFWFKRHEDNKKVTVTVTAHEFIKKLIIHIPEHGFNMLRYYGIYAKPFSETEHLTRILSKPLLNFYNKNYRRWQVRLELTFNKDPLLCSCGGHMEFFDVYIPGQHTKPPPSVLKSIYKHEREA